MATTEYGKLSDAQARNLVVKALRQARVAYRKADTAGEVFERTLDRLILRKKRINAQQLVTLADQYKRYLALAGLSAIPLADSYGIASNF
jgi:hypothetical protein